MGPFASNFDSLEMIIWIGLAALTAVLYVAAIWKTLLLLNDRVKLRRNQVLLCAPLVIVAWSVVFYFAVEGLFGTS
jgi:hypothetical protein